MAAPRIIKALCQHIGGTQWSGVTAIGGGGFSHLGKPLVVASWSI
jgi:hypothetical protein